MIYPILLLITVSWMTASGESLLYSMVIQMVMKEWHLTGAVAALLGFGPVAAAALGGIFLGRFQDLYGRRIGMILSMAVLSAFSILTGMSRSLAWLVAARTGTGFALGGTWTAAMALIGESWPDASRGRALAVVQMGFPLGYISAALASYVAVPWLGWRGAFMINGLLAGAELLGLVLFLPESHLWSSERPPRSGSTSGLDLLFRDYSTRRLVVAASAISFLGMYGYWAGMTWLPSYLQEVGIPTATVPIAMSIILLGALLGYPAFGFLGDRLGRTRAFQFFFAGMGIVSVSLGLAPALMSRGVHLKLEAVVAVGLALAFFSGYFSGYGPFFAELFPTRIRGVALGFCFNIGRLGSAIGPIVSGAIIPYAGVGGAIALAGIGFGIAILLVRRLPETVGTMLKA